MPITKISNGVKLKICLISFILSLPFWWGTNVLEKNLEDFLFQQEIVRNPQILTAEINQKILEIKLERLKLEQRQAELLKNLEIEARATISVLVNNFGEKIIFKKDSDKKLPIASLTKLMTAYVVLENYDLSQVVKIPEKAIGKDSNSGNFKIGESFGTQALLYSLLIESSNTAAIALAELVGEEAFIELMNLEAKNILGSENQNTFFGNPTGLDPKNSNEKISYSTAEDLAKLAAHLLKEQPLIWQISSYQEFDLYSAEGDFHHKILNTNELLGEIPGVVGGKTGETPKSGGCLLLVLESPGGDGFLINIILGSDDRFREMEKIINLLSIVY